MKRIVGILLLVSFLVACEKNDNNDEQGEDQVLMNGMYKGTFNRTGMDTVPVSLSLHEGKFEGTSGQNQYYPAICSGTFARDGMTVTFSDTCVWPANFDWTLILNGRYELSSSGNDVRIWKQNGNTTDEYWLTKASR